MIVKKKKHAVKRTKLTFERGFHEGRELLRRDLLVSVQISHRLTTHNDNTEATATARKRKHDTTKKISQHNTAQKQHSVWPWACPATQSVSAARRPVASFPPENVQSQRDRTTQARKNTYFDEKTIMILVNPIENGQNFGSTSSLCVLALTHSYISKSKKRNPQKHTEKLAMKSDNVLLIQCNDYFTHTATPLWHTQTENATTQQRQ